MSTTPTPYSVVCTYNFVFEGFCVDFKKLISGKLSVEAVSIAVAFQQAKQELLDRYPNIQIIDLRLDKPL